MTIEMNAYPPMALSRLQRWWSLHSHAQSALSIAYLARCDSTNAQLYRSPKRHNTLLVAEQQTQGRGQFERSWVSYPGDLMFSLGLLLPVSKLPALSLRIGVALARVLAAQGLTLGLKYPNDLVASEGKLAGILVQTQNGDTPHQRWTVIGVGVNVHSRTDEYTASAFSPIGLAQLLPAWQVNGVAVGQRERLLLQMVDEILWRIEATTAMPDVALMRDWNALDVWRDTVVRWTHEVTQESLVGIGRGIDEQGNYCLELADGSLHRVHTGQIRRHVAGLHLG